VFFLNRTTQKALIILGLVILLLSLVYVTGDIASRYTLIEDLILTGLSPVQGFFSQLGTQALGIFYGIYDYPRLQEEARLLQEELARRENLQHQLLELQKENYRLREMLGFTERTEYELLPAEVIARDPSYWFETITINKGYSDGVEQDMAVLTADGLVGNIYFVSRNASKVLLLTDSRRAVSALVQRSREPGNVGIVEGYPEMQGLLRMINLPPEANIQPGDTIISAGLGGVFPKGLVIGKVLEIEIDQFGLLQRAIIQPAVNFNRLEEVLIVMEAPPGEMPQQRGEEFMGEYPTVPRTPEGLWQP